MDLMINSLFFYTMYDFFRIVNFWFRHKFSE